MIFTDSAGNQLHEYGFLQSEADLCYFVCFDDYPWIGRMLHIFWVERAKSLIRDRINRGIEPIVGSKAWGVQNTGRGYPITPEELKARSFSFTEDDNSGSLERRSMRIVKEFLRGFQCTFRDATLDEQKRGVDLITPRRKIECKSRGENKPYPHLFLQRYESNPDRVFQ
jgi:hypothetical protein